jgi:hypothetical protein
LKSIKTAFVVKTTTAVTKLVAFDLMVRFGDSISRLALVVRFGLFRVYGNTYFDHSNEIGKILCAFDTSI